MSTRVEMSARSVITPDPMINLNEIGVPEYIALQITYPDNVTKSNINFLNKCIIEGKKGNQWASGLDTGCVWGRKLSAFDLEKNCLISVNSRTKK